MTTEDTSIVDELPKLVNLHVRSIVTDSLLRRHFYFWS